ncbi:MAG TPA: transporter, partial [Planctomycetes bacterium]|nr:transporter [Planctomycetota bacterium]
MPTRLPAALGLALCGLLGCASYEPDPLEPRALLDALREVRLAEVDAEEVAPITSRFDPSDGLTLREASAVAVRRNPSLRALRAAVGVAESRLIQA